MFPVILSHLIHILPFFHHPHPHPHCHGQIIILGPVNLPGSHAVRVCVSFIRPFTQAN